MAFQLAVLRGRSSTQTIRLGSDVTVVGRQDGCQLQIRSSQVSRKHCELREQDGFLLVKDLDSSNGTFINGKKVSGTQRAEHGMELSFGGVKFRVERIGEQVAAAAPVAGKSAKDTAVPEPVELDDGTPILLGDGDEAPSELDAAPTVMDAQPDATPDGADQLIVLPDDDSDTGADLSEDAVADFLFDIDIDEDDKV